MINENQNNVLVGKAWQRIIREKKNNDYNFELFGEPNKDISNAICKPISYEQAKTVILEYEWLGTMGTTQRHYGIFYDDYLAGVVCFGYFQAMQGYATYVGTKYEKAGVQLSRGACVSWAHEHSGSKLIAYGLNEEKKLGAKYCIAFSDPKAGEIGTLYQATNWLYLGTANHSPHYDVYYKNGKLFMNDRDFHKKYGFSGFKKLQDFVSKNNELVLKKREDKSRYIKLLGNRRENKEILVYLKDKILPYPKRAEEVSR